MSFSQGCLFVQAFLASGTKAFGISQNSATTITYSDPDSTPNWTNPTAALLKQDGTNLNVLGATLLQVFPVSGSDDSGSIGINLEVLNGLGSTPKGKIWDAFTGNGRLKLSVSTSDGIKILLVQLRSLQSPNYSLNRGTRLAACLFPSGCSAPDFNFSGESASNFTAQFIVPGHSNLTAAAFAPDNFSIPSGNLPAAGNYSTSQLALTRKFTVDSNDKTVPEYSVPSNLPSDFTVV